MTGNGIRIIDNRGDTVRVNNTFTQLQYCQPVVKTHVLRKPIE
jgi:hypothetical protein